MSGVQVDADGGIVISGYSPVEATLKDGTNVTVTGQYPFADNATVVVTPAASAANARQPLTVALRIPCWTTSAAITVGAAGATAAATLQATPCSLFKVPPTMAAAAAADGESGALSLTIQFGHVVKVTTNNQLGDQKWEHPANAVEIRRGPLLFTFPIPTITNITQLNGTRGCELQPGKKCHFPTMPASYVKQTDVSIDQSKPWQIALQSPTAASLVFSGFNPLSAVPFDHTKPSCTLKVQAKVVVDKDPKGYPKGEARVKTRKSLPTGNLHEEQPSMTFRYGNLFLLLSADVRYR